ncbi:hypothetical protein [Streptomyces subrutilus]
MDERMDERMDEWMNGWTDGRITLYGGTGPSEVRCPAAGAEAADLW